MNKANYSAAEKYVFSRLERELPATLYFHGPSHTREILNTTERLADLESVSVEELFLLKTGALYHDIGFLEQYQNNESLGVRIAENSLSNFGYDLQQIEIVSGIILATRLPQNPRTKLEELMCDADLDNLGREDFYIKTEQLRREFAEYGISKTPREWYEDLIPFLEQHKYFTKSAKRLRQKQKERHLHEIRQLLGIV